MMYRFLCLCLFILFTGCYSTELDEQEPGLVILSPFEATNFLAGSEVNFNLDAFDLAELEEVTIRVHDNNFDHNEEAPGWLFEWDTTIVYKLFGQSSSIEFMLPLPDNLPSSSYHAVIEAVDASGNFSGRRLVNFNVIAGAISNFAPEIAMPTNPITLFPGTLFTVNGTVTDDGGLQSVHVRVRPVDATALLYENLTPLNGNLSYTFQELILAPATSGSYVLQVIAMDQTGLERIESIAITVP